MTRLVFLGTPEAAVPTLASLVEVFEVTLVVTQPDRPRGRSGRPMPPPVKEYARSRELPVAQPADRAGLHEAITGASPLDLAVVVAYGRILRPEVLEMPTKGVLNVHFSLLPRWRGAAPVARALMAGDTMTGVTIIKLDEGLDTGPVLTAQAVDVVAGEDAGELTDRLAHLGARLLTTVLPSYVDGSLSPVPQVDEGATYADKITAADRALGPDLTPDTFVNKVLGLAPTPGATLLIDGEPHKILEAAPSEHTPPPGRWESIHGVPVVSAGDGGVEILRIQPPGKVPLVGADWARGRPAGGGPVDSS